MWKEAVTAWLWYYLSICFGRLNEAKHLNHTSWSLGQDLNQGSPRYDAGVLSTQVWHSVLRWVCQDILACHGYCYRHKDKEILWKLCVLSMKLMWGHTLLCTHFIGAPICATLNPDQIEVQTQEYLCYLRRSASLTFTFNTCSSQAQGGSLAEILYSKLWHHLATLATSALFFTKFQTAIIFWANFPNS